MISSLYRSIAASLVIAALVAPAVSVAAPGTKAVSQRAASDHQGGAKRDAATPRHGADQGKRASAASSINHPKSAKRDIDVDIKKGGGNTVNVNSNNKRVTDNSIHNKNNRRYAPPPPGYRAGGYYYGGHYYYDDDDGLGFIGKVAVASTAALLVGAILTDKPDDCTQQVSYGQVYLYCNGVWYQPMQSGSNTTYVVVNKP